ncbi:MAG: aspartate ammonia-lyase [Pseudomonadales bacterium]|jgi:aspartate ammonia-lyase|nr:aspartate ammonia-lyase [Pseudomonadales bacterium]
MNTPQYRAEHDLLGEEQVPADAYYGIQTLRALRNFRITGVPISHHPQLVIALAYVKQACAKANAEIGLLEQHKMQAICAACQEIIAGKLHDQFPVDLIQGGAGTSTNMNANEVIANRALELLGHAKGDYQHLHPNNDVNMSQSTNDVYPTAARLALLLGDDPLVLAITHLRQALEDKALEFKDILKMGRTEMQDAVPMTLGQEFGGWAITLDEDLTRLMELAAHFTEVNLGGTAIGTGINTHPDYARRAVTHLARDSGFDFKLALNLVEATPDTGDFVLFSSMLKRFATKLSKIANDLRLLSSGPRAGFNEINLPPVQPGSSIMPGKVNPVIPEAVNQVAFQVIGNDLALTLAAEGGQLQLNPFEPVILYNLLGSLNMLTAATDMLRERCIEGISANRAVCEAYVQNSIGVITVFSPYTGYENATRIAREALHSGKGVVELIQREGLLDEALIAKLMTRENLTGPSAMLPANEYEQGQTHLLQ